MAFPSPFPEPSCPPKSWTLATYNVQDLFDTIDDPEAADERPTENQLQNKLTRLGRMLQVLDADVVGLMEVETLGVLQRLNTEALAELGYTETILIEGNDPERGIDVALLSRFPVVQTISHAAETWTDEQGHPRRLFSRDCLECHLTLPSGETLVVLVNHFKSKRGGVEETQPLRMAQAARVRQIADDLMARHPLVAVIGDLNDSADSPALAPLLSDAALTDLAAQDVPADHCYTFVYAGQPERIDFILASPALAALFVPGSGFIPHSVWARKASDHAPVRAAFGVGPAYAENLTVTYDRAYPPCLPRRGPARINAARFWWRDLNALTGQIVIVTGRVLRVEVTNGVGTVRLFLGSSDPYRAFRVTILPEDAPTFAALTTSGGIAGYYTQQMVQMVGTLGFYGESPEILARRPAQIHKINV